MGISAPGTEKYEKPELIFIFRKRFYNAVCRLIGLMVRAVPAKVDGVRLQDAVGYKTF